MGETELILLSGENAQSKPWIHEVATELSPLFTATTVQDYIHWQEDRPNIDIGIESSRLAELVAGKKRYDIFAKSAGSLVMLNAVRDGLIKPEHTLITGFPINFAQNVGVDVKYLLDGYSVPTVFMQKSEDPAISFMDLKRYFDSRNMPQQMIEVEGTGSHYEDIEGIYNAYSNLLAA